MAPSEREGGAIMRRHLAAVGIALAVCAGYYFGSRLGLLLRLPPATPSVVWPPNAIVTAALLLVPPRRWWLVLLPVLPVHVLVEVPTGWPLSLVLALYWSNCSEAIIIAAIVWLFSDAPRFDTPRRLLVFFAAIIAGTTISGLLDAGAVTWSLGDPFWTVWRQRLFSNILAQLTIVPSIVGVAIRLPQWRRVINKSRLVEAVFVLCGLIVMGITDLGGLVFEVPALQAISSQAPLVLQLPFLLWAAVRFGIAGAGVTLFAATILAVWSVVHGQGPFAQISPSTTVPALTLSLTLVAATLLALAALMEERRHTQSALAERLDFEELLARLSGAFVEVPSDRMDAGFDEWLGRIGRFLNVKCVRVYLLTERHELVARYEWMPPHYGKLPTPNAATDFPWTSGRLQRSQVLALSSVDDLPPEAERDRQSMRRYGYEATIVLPLVAGDRGLGALAIAAAEQRPWPDEIVMRLRLVAEVLANALARKQTEDALRASEAMKSSILSSLRSGVAVVDRDCSVLALNDSWAVLARQSGEAFVRVGDNLLDAWTRDARLPSNAEELGAGVLSVLRGERDSFGYEYTTQLDAKRSRETRWWSVVVVPLDRPEGGAVVTRADVTDLRKAELDVQRIRQELAHVGRVSMVGELTTSLAHELYQPLTAIMTNAQAARRMLAASPPDLSQVQAILSDIVNDDRRASDVIERLRDLLRKGELEMVPVDLPSIIRDVAHLLRSEAMVKHVTVSLDLDGFPVVVLADRVQLQQVLLNLLHNAIEAMVDGRSQATNVVVRCRRNGDSAIVTVRDTGPGLGTGTEETVFEPFYTTKKDGMGMGLSIVRSILESHGGSIRASNTDSGGASFEFTLPLAVEAQPTPQAVK